MISSPCYLPPALRTGDTVGIMAPSSYVEPEKLAAGVAVLEQAGFKAKIHPQTFARHNQSAGTPAEKIAAFHDLLKDKEVKAIVATGGGNRSALMLEGLNYDLILQNPKSLMGFSDCTALQNGIYAKTGLTSFYGPTISRLSAISPESLQHSLGLLRQSPASFSFPTDKLRPLKTGSARGVFVGGTLSVFSSLIGTPYLPDVRGKILFLEEVSEELSRIDRMLWQLRVALPFETLAGILFGQFTSCEDTGRRPFGFTLEDSIREKTAGLSCPVAMNAAFGHGETFFALPIGGCGEMTLGGETQEDSRISLLISPHKMS